MNFVFRSLVTLLVLAGLAAPVQAEAGIDWQVLGNIDVGAEIRDMAISAEGRWIYVLTAANEIRIYTSGGKLKGAMPIDPGYARIKTGPRDDILLVSNQNEKRVQLVSVNPINDFNLTDAPTKGPENAPVTIAVFSDFECAYCARLPKILDQVAAEYPAEVKIAFKHYPLRSHDFAIPAAQAAVAAQQQGKFWEFHDRLFEHFNELDEERIQKAVKELGLDGARFEKDRKAERTQRIIEADRREGYQAGVSGTPAMFINGKKQYRRDMNAIVDTVEREIEAHSKAKSSAKPQ
jgi:protein-disulfide isomerase